MKIYFECKDEYLLIDGRPHTGGCKIIEDGDMMDICHCGNEPYAAPLMVRLRLRGGLLSQCDDIRVTRWDKDVMSISFAEKLCHPFIQPEPIAMQCVKVRGKSHNLTLYRQNGYYITIETCDEIFTKRIPLRCCSQDVCVNLSVCESRNCVTLIAVVKGCDKEYMLALNYSDDYYPLACVLADCIDVDGCEISVTDNIKDMCRLAVCRRYLIEGGQINLCDTRYIYRDDCIDYAPLLLPYVYIESVLIGDMDKCNEICSCNDKLHLFKGCTSLVAPPHRRLRPYEIALLRPTKGGGNAQYYDFTVKDSLITGITRHAGN
ncbi:MAG: hypothetical protein K2M44_00265 [Clostridia bacterium]|nr:hypothetical protein [Clostridia bacterium]